MNLTIQKYEDGSIPLDTIIEFIRNIDKEIDQPIGLKMHIDEYVRKILDNGIMLIALQGEDIAGLCGFYCNNLESKIAFLTFIGISSSFRGKGVASSLLNNAAMYAQTRGMSIMRLETSASNTSALSLYRKHGFLEYEHRCDLNGQPVAVYLECNLLK